MATSIPRPQPAARRAAVKSTSLRALAVAAHLERVRPAARPITADSVAPPGADWDDVPHPRNIRPEPVDEPFQRIMERPRQRICA